MIKKILIFTASMLFSTNILCDWGYIDIYNETGENTNIDLKRYNDVLITPRPEYNFSLAVGKMKPAYLGISKSMVLGVNVDLYGDIEVSWTQSGKKYTTRRLIRPDNVRLRKNGEYVTRDYKDSLLLPIKHTEKALAK